MEFVHMMQSLARDRAESFFAAVESVAEDTAHLRSIFYSNPDAQEAIFIIVDGTTRLESEIGESFLYLDRLPEDIPSYRVDQTQTHYYRPLARIAVADRNAACHLDVELAKDLRSNNSLICALDRIVADYIRAHADTYRWILRYEDEDNGRLCGDCLMEELTAEERNADAGELPEDMSVEFLKKGDKEQSLKPSRISVSEQERWAYRRRYREINNLFKQIKRIFDWPRDISIPDGAIATAIEVIDDLRSYVPPHVAQCIGVLDEGDPDILPKLYEAWETISGEETLLDNPAFTPEDIRDNSAILKEAIQ